MALPVGGVTLAVTSKPVKSVDQISAAAVLVAIEILDG